MLSIIDYFTKWLPKTNNYMNVLLFSLIQLHQIFKYTNHRDIPNQTFQAPKSAYYFLYSLKIFNVSIQREVKSIVVFTKNKLLASKKKHSYFYQKQVSGFTNQQSRNIITSEWDSLHYTEPNCECLQSLFSYNRLTCQQFVCKQ